MNVYLNKFMVYFEIHRLYREGFSIRQISEELVLNRRTVSKYLSMFELEFEQMMIDQSERNKVLSPYESFVKSRLEKFRDTPAAQMHDWLKEHFKDLPKVSQKTVFNFVPLKSFAAKGLESGCYEEGWLYPCVMYVVLFCNHDSRPSQKIYKSE